MRFTATMCMRAQPSVISRPQGWSTVPCGIVNANAVSLVLGTLAHNLALWSAAPGGLAEGALVTTTLLRPHLTVPGRLTCSGERWRLTLHARRPRREQFLTALERIRTLPNLAPG